MSNEDSCARVTFLSHVIRKSKLKPGDHIYVWRFFYQHHGIYTGEGGDKDVIHVTGKRKDSATVCSTSLSKFLGLVGILCLVSYNDPQTKKKIRGTAHTTPSLPADQVLQNAKQYLVDPQSWGRYRLLKRNCEDFAYYCKTEKKNRKELTETYRTQASGTLAKKILGSFVSHDEDSLEMDHT